LTLGLSGWTTNDWTRGSALDLLAPPAAITAGLLDRVSAVLQEKRSMNLAQLQSAVTASSPAVTAALRRFAFAGQVIYDLPHGVYRFRQVMPMPLGDGQLGPENAELTSARHLLLTDRVTLDRVERTASAVLLVGNVESTPVELLVDLDGRIR